MKNTPEAGSMLYDKSVPAPTPDPAGASVTTTEVICLPVAVILIEPLPTPQPGHALASMDEVVPSGTSKGSVYSFPQSSRMTMTYSPGASGSSTITLSMIMAVTSCGSSCG